MTTFKELGINKQILKAVEEMGFEEATPIQEQTIPRGLKGIDVIGQAQTGTGKTAAFGIPLLEKIDKNQKTLQGIIVAPTRELAIQVGEELNRIGKYIGAKALPIYGGQEMGRQIRALKGKPPIVVATPGRLLDHIRRKTIRLETVHTVILDEADEMLNMGFIEDIHAILEAIPPERQTLLFSATMPNEIKEIATKMMRDPETVRIQAKQLTVENIDQYYVEVNEKQKFDSLTRLLDIDAPELSIIFGRTKRRVDELANALNTRGYNAEGIHGDLSQSKRLSVLNKFKSGRLEVLVATDVAARGLDISGVTHVYNFDIPQDPESYVHRIGRTGRAGNKGKAISFVTPREIAQLHLIEKMTKRKVERLPVPSQSEAKRGQQQASIDKLLETIKDGELEAYRDAANDMLNEHDSLTVISAAIKVLTNDRNEAPVQLSSVQPISVKNAVRDKDKSKRSNKEYRAGGRGGGYKGKQAGKGGGNRRFNKRGSDQRGQKRG
ncbi:DEAD/DEAH box helicase [Bacillaceae bacterium S4-13-58]